MHHVKKNNSLAKRKSFISMYIDGENKTGESFMDNYKWLLNGGFDALSYEHEELFESSGKEYSIDDIVAASVPKNFGEQKKKKKQKAYYNANSLIFEYVLKEVFTKELYIKLCRISKQDKIMVQSRYRDILQWLMLDRRTLINEYNTVIINGIYYKSNRRVSSLGLHNTLRQSIYGNMSYNSFSDYEPSAGIAVVRQLVELRIRRAFGILGYIDIQMGVRNPSLCQPYLKF